MSESELLVTTFYSLCDFSRFEDVAHILRSNFDESDLLGTVLICDFGISATVSGSDKVIQRFKDCCVKQIGPLSFVDSRSFVSPFRKLKILTRGRILNTGSAGGYAESAKESFLSPVEWANLIENNDKVALIDTRNDYEVEVGTYRGAINFCINNFREFFTKFEEYCNSGNLDGKDSVAVFCTGGVRCDLILNRLSKIVGVNKKVFQLHGGILGYFDYCKKYSSSIADLWNGDCFVFDDRFAVNKDMKTVPIVFCKECNEAVSENRVVDRCKPRCFSCSNSK